MSKDSIIKTQGQVVEVLPNTMFRVAITDKHTILATISGKMRKNNINVSLNDRVEVEISVYDLSKGRITYRYR
jgi:translation initiation factor IF-1